MQQSFRLVTIVAVCSLALGVSLAAQGQYTESQNAGFHAGFICSGVFVAKRDLADVLRDELGQGGLPGGGTISASDIAVDYDTKSVRVAYSGSDVPRLAVFWDGFGTILMPEGATLTDVEMLPRVDVPFPSGDAAKIPWPNGDMLSDTPLPGEVDLAKLEAAIEGAFSAEKFQPSKTLGVVIVYKDRVIAERYAPSWNMHTQYRSWSTAKSITNALIGILVEKGKLDVSDPAPIPEWHEKGDRRGAITIENLLHMSSGLQSTGSATGKAYWGGINTAKEVAAQPLEKEPGTRWKYSNYDTLLLIRSLKEVLGDKNTYLTFPRRELLNKIGMRHTFPEIDPYGNFILSSQMYTTARDLARFGLLYLHDGVWDGERILPEGWVDYTRTPAPAKVTGRDWGYGAQFWLFNNDPRVPSDTFTTAGHLGQHSTIVPAHDLVVARTGLDPNVGSKWDQIEFTADVIKAISN